MADNTRIEWADATANVVNGCTVHSPGCTNCYAMRSGARGLPGHPSTGLTQPSKAGHVWTGEVRFNERRLLEVLRWKRPRRVFWNAHGDLFHDNVPDEWIDRCFAVMALTPQHQHQVLTKRSARMREYMTALACGDRYVIGHILDLVPGLYDPRKSVGLRAFKGSPTRPVPLPNVWLGVSVEDQARADERIPDLLSTPAAWRWLSCEPLLGPVDLKPRDRSDQCIRCGEGPEGEHDHPDGYRTRGLDWIVAGGESGAGARPMHPDWVRQLRDQCARAGVPFLFKQWGNFAPEGVCSEKWIVRADGSYDPMPTPNGIGHHPPRHGATFMYRVGKGRAGRLLDGVQHDGFPA